VQHAKREERAHDIVERLAVSAIELRYAEEDEGEGDVLETVQYQSATTSISDLELWGKEVLKVVRSWVEGWKRVWYGGTHKFKWHRLATSKGSWSGFASVLRDVAWLVVETDFSPK
jgi:hypothetical protein